MNDHKIIAVIPTRMNSSRMPGKPLTLINGLPMIEHVRRRTNLCKGFAKIIVATCDKEIRDVVKKNGGEVMMTSKKHKMASDRVHEVAQKINCSHIINIQGDEVLIVPDDINLMISFIKNNPKFDFLNGVKKLIDKKELKDRNIVKCVTGIHDQIIFCSRYLDKSLFNYKLEKCNKILGILGFSKKGLSRFSQMKRSTFEKNNSIDQSRIIENGSWLQGVKFNNGYIGINDQNEKKRVLKILKNDKKQINILEKIIKDANIFRY